jgi:nitrogen fixation protein FixH
MTEAIPNPKRWNPWPVSIIAFFAVAIVGFTVFIAFCNLHPVDLVTEDYYEQELRFQRQLESQSRAVADQQAAAVAYHASGRQVTVAFPTNTPLARLSGNIQLYRPSSRDQDRRIEVNPDATGVQTIDAASLAPGLWKVRVAWVSGGRDYFVEQSIVIK